MREPTLVNISLGGVEIDLDDLALVPICLLLHDSW